MWKSIFSRSTSHQSPIRTHCLHSELFFWRTRSRWRFVNSWTEILELGWVRPVVSTYHCFDVPLFRQICPDVSTFQNNGCRNTGTVHCFEKYHKLSKHRVVETTVQPVFSTTYICRNIGTTHCFDNLYFYQEYIFNIFVDGVAQWDHIRFPALFSKYLRILPVLKITASIWGSGRGLWGHDFSARSEVNAFFFFEV